MGINLRKPDPVACEYQKVQSNFMHCHSLFVTLLFTTYKKYNIQTFNMQNSFMCTCMRVSVCFMNVALHVFGHIHLCIYIDLFWLLIKWYG